MGCNKPLPSWRIKKILDEAAMGKSFRTLARELKEPVSTVAKVIHALPLWEWAQANRKPAGEL